MLVCSCFARPVPCTRGWPLGWLLWPLWKTPSRMVFSLSWRSLRNPLSRLPRACSSHRAPSLPLAHSFSSLQGRSQPCPTGLSVKSCPAAPPDRSVSSHRHSCSSAEAPHRPSLALQLLTRVRLPLGRLVACLRRRRSKATQAGQAPPSGATTPNDRCGARFSVKTPCAVQCGTSDGH